MRSSVKDRWRGEGELVLERGVGAFVPEEESVLREHPILEDRRGQRRLTREEEPWSAAAGAGSVGSSGVYMLSPSSSCTEETANSHRRRCSSSSAGTKSET